MPRRKKNRTWQDFPECQELSDQLQAMQERKHKLLARRKELQVEIRNEPWKNHSEDTVAAVLAGEGIPEKVTQQGLQEKLCAGRVRAWRGRCRHQDDQEPAAE